MQRHEVLETDRAIGKPQRYIFQGEQSSEKSEILIFFQSMTWKQQLSFSR